MKKPILVLLLVYLIPAVSVFCTGWWEPAPPGLGHQMERLPAKSLGQLLIETGLGVESPATPLDETAARTAWIQAIQTLPRKEAVVTLDAALVSARATGAVRDVFNLLHDLRDACADAAVTPADLAPYAQWRMQHDWSSALEGEGRSELEKKFGTAPAGLAPYYLYLQGAALFRAGREADAIPVFENLLARYPGSARVEAARFVLARCHTDQTRVPYFNARENVDLIQRAKAAMLDYLKRYPEGRFAADARGWMGGLEYLRRDYIKALAWFLDQLQDRKHPEQTRSASAMIERVLAGLLVAPDAGELRELARHPVIATAAVHWICTTGEADMNDGVWDRPDRVAKWRKKLLAAIAVAVAEEKKAWQSSGMELRMAFVLAHAASAAGDHAGALEILSRVPEKDAASSEDLFFLNALVLQRAGNFPKAIETWQAFHRDFGFGPLGRGARFQLALCYQDSGTAADAVRVVQGVLAEETPPEGSPTIATYLDTEMYPPGIQDLPLSASALSPALTLITWSQLRYYLDALLLFAPLEELKNLGPSEMDAKSWQLVSRAVCLRALRENKPAIALAFANPEIAKDVQQILALRAGAVESDRAADWIALGDGWAAGRSVLSLMPFHEAEVFGEGDNGGEVKRIENAAALGFGKNAVPTLEKMDALRMAFESWMKAADLALKGSSEQAHALFLCLEAMPRLGRATPWRAQRMADDPFYNRTASILYLRLLKDCPSSAEASTAARPSFHRPSRSNPDTAYPPIDPSVPEEMRPDDTIWPEDIYASGEPYVRDRDFKHSDLNAFQLPDRDDHYGDKRRGALFSAIYALPLQEISQRSPDVLRLQKDANAVCHSIYDACVVSFLNDLCDLADMPDIPLQVASRYAALRRDAILCGAWKIGHALRTAGAGDQPAGEEYDARVMHSVESALADPAMKPVGDLLAALRLYLIANHTRTADLPKEPRPDAPFPAAEDWYETRDYARLAAEADAFLKQYPHSIRREAAWVHRIRALYRGSRPILYSADVPFPDNSSVFGGILRKPIANESPWNPGAVLAAIDSYRKEFPGGRGQFAPEIREVEALVAYQSKDWQQSLTLTVAALSDVQNADLHEMAALRLANIFAQLENPPDRRPLLAAISRTEGARKLLLQYLDATDASRSLEPLWSRTRWIREQLGQ